MSLDTTVISTSHRPSAIVVDGDEVAHLHAMPQGTDILLSSPACHHVARSLEQDPELLIVVVIDITAMTSGNARVQVARVAAASRSAS